MELLGELTRRYPVFYANGNHEDRLELKKETFGMPIRIIWKRYRAWASGS